MSGAGFGVEPEAEVELALARLCRVGSEVVLDERRMQVGFIVLVLWRRARGNLGVVAFDRTAGCRRAGSTSASRSDEAGQRRRSQSSAQLQEEASGGHLASAAAPRPASRDGRWWLLRRAFLAVSCTVG